MGATVTDVGQNADEKSGKTQTSISVGASVLSGKSLRVLLEKRDPAQKLVVAPLLEPDEQLRDGQASIDIRLGSQFVLTQASAYGELDEYPTIGEVTTKEETADEVTTKEETAGLPNLRRLYQELYVPIGDSLVVHPHQFVLATSFEYLRLPPNLMAFVVGRSTWGRLGLVVATAIGIHPLFAGTLTLEIRNLGETPLRLYPGERIAQLFFQWVDVDPEQASKPGRYVASVNPFPKFKVSGPTHTKLRKLVDAYRASMRPRRTPTK